MSDNEQLDRREQLMAALDAAEEGTLEAPIEKDIEMAKKDDISEESAKEEVSAQDTKKLPKMLRLLNLRLRMRRRRKKLSL